MHEADGTGYDTMTIRYDAFVQPRPDPLQEVTIDLSATSENAIAMVAVELAYPGEVYVTGTIQAGVNDLPLIQTFKIVSGGSTVPNWIRLFGNAIRDVPAAIIAPERSDGSVSVMVFGQSFYYGGTSYDQVGVHYTQPPPHNPRPPQVDTPDTNPKGARTSERPFSFPPRTFPRFACPAPFSARKA